MVAPWGPAPPPPASASSSLWDPAQDDTWAPRSTIVKKFGTGTAEQRRAQEASPGRLQSPRRKCCPFFFSFFLFFSFIKRKPLLKITRQISIMNCSCLYVDNYKDKIRPEVSAFSLPLAGVLRGCVSPQSWVSGVTVLVEVAAPGPPSPPPPELPPELAASIQRGSECSWGLSPSPRSGVHCPGLVASP